MTKEEYESNKNKVSNCPFCGSKPVLKIIGNEFTKKRSAQIFCHGCCTKMSVGAIIRSSDWCVEQIIIKWNKRI